MRVGFDASILGTSTRYSGIGQYSLRLLNGLAQINDSNEYLLYAPPDCPRPEELDSRLQWRSLPRPRLGKLSELSASAWTVPRAAEADELDVFHAPTVHPRPSWPAVPVGMRCPLVVTLHDLIPLNFYSDGPSRLPLHWRLFYRWNLRAASRAALIITVSEAARQEILGRLSLDHSRVRVIYNGVEAPPDVRTATTDARPYIMYVGSYEPRKNLLRVVRAYWQAARRDLPHDLVVIADPASGDTQGVNREIAAFGLTERIRLLHAVSEEHLWELYRGADLFVFPSLAEGFGLPPLEAMAAGTPVIASDIPALREVLGDAACFVDPRSEEGIAAAILELAHDPVRRAELAKLGMAQAGRYSWRACAEKTLAAYEDAAGRPGSPGTRRRGVRPKLASGERRLPGAIVAPGANSFAWLSKMRIGFDATVLAPATRYTGTGQYAEKLVAALPLLAPDDELVLYGSKPPGLPEPPANVTWRPVGRLPIGRLSALAGHLLTLPRLARKDRLDMLHVPTVHTRASLPPVPRALPCPLVVTIHDLIPLTYYGRSDKPLPWRLRTFYRWNLNSALKAKRIITVSESSRAEILTTLGLSPDRVVAIHNGVDFGPAAGRPMATDWKPPHGEAPYVLFGGSFEPRKNLPRLLDAFDAAVKAGLEHHLLMIVDSASGHAQPALDQARKLACAGRLHFLSGLDESTLCAVYNGADAFIFPTLSEGFGLPPLQAMACGVPVIASDIPVMREVLGDAAYYVDPHSVDEIARSLITVTSDDSLRQKLSEAGPLRAANFTWEAAARQTLEVYRAVATPRRSATAGESQA